MFRFFSTLADSFHQLTLKGETNRTRRPLHMVEVESRVLLSASPIDFDSDPYENDFSEVLHTDSSSLYIDETDYNNKIDEITELISSIDSNSIEENALRLEEPYSKVLPATVDAESLPRELVIIDGGLDDIEELLSELLESRPNGKFDVHILDSGKNGIEQISSIFQQSDLKFDAVHILSHGNNGSVMLGSGFLSSENLNEYSAQLSQWSNFLTNDADLLFYGCQLVEESSGKQLAQSLAVLTGADVAASEDLTGSSESGGNWVLEYQYGLVETKSFEANGYTYTLDIINGTAGSDILEGTSLADTITGAGGNDIILGGQDILGIGNFNSSSTLSQSGVSGTNSGWTITSSAVDFLGTDSSLSLPYDPNDTSLRAIDLNNGGIETSLSGLTIGQTYSVVFFMGADGETTQTLDVGIDGISSLSTSVTTPSGNSLATMDWQPKVYSFTATSSTHTLQFLSTSGTSSDGPIITTVRVVNNNSADGDDLIYGNDGADIILAGSGANDIYGGDGDDVITSGSGIDYIYGEAGNDLVRAGDGYDNIVGGLGVDILYGEGGGDDFGFGEAEDGVQDFIDGGDGDDWYYVYENNTPDVYQDSGTDGLEDAVLFSTAGNSTYFLTDSFSKAATGIDKVAFIHGNSYTSSIGSSSYTSPVNWDFTGIELKYIDQIQGSTQSDNITIDISYLNESIAVYGNDGDDTIHDTGTGAHVLHGGDGNDTVFGGAGNDSIYGQAGTDSSIYNDIFVNYVIDRNNYLGNNDSGYITVTETTVTGVNEGVDFVYGTVEKLLFADGTYDVASGLFTSTAPSDIELGNPVGVNLVTNGSFEDNSGTTGSSNVGLSSLPGWTAIGGEGFELWKNFNDSGPGTASDGQSNLEINVGNGAINGISQNIATVSGQKYVLSFDLSSRFHVPSSELEIYWNGFLVGTIIQSEVSWKTHSFVVTGTGGLDELKFLETANNNSNGSALLDNVRLVAANSPSISVNENSAPGTVVAFTGSVDPTTAPIDSRTYSFSDDAGGRFAIDAVTGVITVADGSLLDYESASSHNITIRVTDSLGGYREESFTIAVNNLDDIPLVAITEDSNSDGYLNISEISGTIGVRATLPAEAKAGDTISISDGNTPQNILLDSSDISTGYIDVSFASPGDGNTISITAIITDANGYVWSVSPAVNALVDTSAPSTSTVTITEDSNNDGYLNISESAGNVDVRITLPGDAVVGDTLTVSDGISPQNIVLTSTHITNGYLDTSFASPGDGNSISVNAYLTDIAGNASAISASDTALVDTSAPNASITIDANITADDVVNASEASGNISITGSVGGDVQDGDTVTLTINGILYNGTVSGGAFNILVAGADLALDADSTIDASVTTTDLAGNSAAVSDTESYSVDTSPPSVPTVTITEDVNNDGYLNISESVGNVDVRIALPGDAVAGDTLTVSDGISPQNIVLTSTHITNGYLDTSFASPGDGNSISVNAYLTDVAGNASAISAADSALVDTSAPNASITLDANITADDIINAAETSGNISITGSVGGDVQDGDTLTLTINGILYNGTVSGGAFNILVAGADLALDADSTIDASVTTTDLAGNSTAVSDTESYSVDTSPPSVPTVTITEDVNNDGYLNISESVGNVDVRITLPGDAVVGDTLTVSDGISPQDIVLTSTHITNGYLDTSFASPGDGNSISVNAYLTDVAGNASAISAADSALVDTSAPNASITLDANITADDIINAAETSGNISITGSVGGDVQDGDTVTLTINGILYNGMVSGGAFNILVAGADLALDADSTIDASVTTTDLAENSTAVSDTESYSVDTSPPSVPTVTVTEDVNNDGYLNISESVGNVDVRIILPGDAAAGDTLTVSDGIGPQNIVLTSTHITNGYLDTSFASPGDGNSISVNAYLTDVAGNASAVSISDSALVDTSAPSTPTVTITEDVNNDGYLNISESVGNVDVRVTLPGDALAGDTLTVSDGISPQNIVLTSTHITNGYLDTSFVSPGDGNSISVNAYLTDVAGNASAISAADSALVDTSAPNASITLDANITADDVVNAAETSGNIFITGSVGGDVQDGDTVTLTINGILYNGTVSGGVFNILVAGSDLALDADSTIDASVTTTDLAGNSTAVSDTESYSVDTSPPSVPTVTITEDVNNDGYLNISESVGNVDVRIALPGDAVAGDTLTVSDGISPQNIVLTSTHITNGYLDTSFASPGDGNSISVNAYLTDVAGNASAISAADSALVDTSAPNASITLDANITADDIINAAETSGNISITGSVGGDVQDGDIITLTIHGTIYTGIVSSGAFNILVAGSDLAMDSDSTVESSVTTSDLAGNRTTNIDTEDYYVDLSDSESGTDENTNVEETEDSDSIVTEEELIELSEPRNEKDDSAQPATEKKISNHPLTNEDETDHSSHPKEFGKPTSKPTQKESLGSLEVSTPLKISSKDTEFFGKSVNHNNEDSTEINNNQKIFETLFDKYQPQVDSTPEEQEILLKERFINYSLASGSAIATIGYLLWAVRGGVLMASVLSSLPNWRFIDPLPILDHFESEDGLQDADEFGINELLNEVHKI